MMISILLTVKITLINIKFYNLKAAGKRSPLNAPAAFLLPAILFAPPAQPLSRKSPPGYSQDHTAPLAPLVMISPAASLAAIRSIARRSYVFAMRRLTPTAFATSFHGRAHKYLREMVAHNSA